MGEVFLTFDQKDSTRSLIDSFLTSQINTKNNPCVNEKVLQSCNDMLLGEMIAAYRAKKKLSLQQLADLSGVDKTTLWRIEQGRYGSGKHWPAILRWVFGK